MALNMLNLNATFLAYGVGMLGLAMYLFLSITTNGHQHYQCSVEDILTSLLMLSCVLISLMFFHIASLRISSSHTMLTALVIYIRSTLLKIKLIFLRRLLEKAWRDPRKAQEEALQKLLKRNKNTEYGKKYGFGNMSSLDQFRQRHPLTKYDHYQGYIERMASGEENVLLKDKPKRYALTSGTTGKSKMMPLSSESESMLPQYLVYGISHLRKNLFPKYSVLQKGLFFYTEPTPRSTSDGTSLGPLSGMNAKMKRFRSINFSSPREALTLRDPNASTYVNLLFALKDKELGHMMTGFTTRIFTDFRQLEKDWPKVVQDIEQGRLNADVQLPEDVRIELEKAMVPDKERADELRKEFVKGFRGIIKRLWPHLSYINGIDAAGYNDILKEGYASGLPIYSIFYGSTEVPIIGLELSTDTLGGSNEYKLIPTHAVFEFIPEEYMDQERPDTLLIDEVQVGKTYELVVTGLNGMYRFRFGDVVKVVGHHFQCPIIAFQYRSGLVLNVRAEKVDSVTLHKVITEVISNWPQVTLVDYACAESSMLKGGGDADEVNPYYVIFIEIECHGNKKSPEECVKVTKQHTNMIDEVLCKTSFTYNSFREKGEIATPRVHLMQPGSFNKLYEFIFNNSDTSVNQFKNPRKLRTREMVDFMMKNII